MSSEVTDKERGVADRVFILVFPFLFNEEVLNRAFHTCRLTVVYNLLSGANKETNSFFSLTHTSPYFSGGEVNRSES
jgi:hypothetical protein